MGGAARSLAAPCQGCKSGVSWCQETGRESATRWGLRRSTGAVRGPLGAEYRRAGTRREGGSMAVAAKRAALSPEELKGQLRGALAFPITPYGADGSVDLDGVRANAAWLPDAGVCAVVAPSGT